MSFSYLGKPEMTYLIKQLAKAHDELSSDRAQERIEKLRQRLAGLESEIPDNELQLFHDRLSRLDKMLTNARKE
jgi:hypothetical protein